MRIEYFNHRARKAVKAFTLTGSVPNGNTVHSVHPLQPVKSDFNITRQYYMFDFYEVFYDSTGEGYPDNVAYYAVKKEGVKQ